MRRTLASRGFQRVYPKQQLDRWRERNRCPHNDKLCGEAVWMGQTTLLGTRGDMDQIAEAVRCRRTPAASRRLPPPRTVYFAFTKP